MPKSVTFDEFEKLLIKISHYSIKRGSKSVEMHLYMLTTLKLVETCEEGGVSTYFRSPLGDELCSGRTDPLRQEDYRKRLRSVLMLNDVTGPFFRRFLSIIDRRLRQHNPISLIDIKRLFRGETARTLYSLGKEAGLIAERNGLLILRPSRQNNIEDFRKFRQEVEKAYKASKRRERTGAQLRTIYVEISKVRDIVLSVFGMTGPGDKERFDRMLQKLLDSEEGRNIHVYGAAPQWLPERSDPTFEEKVFRYKGKIYAFMSIS